MLTRPNVRMITTYSSTKGPQIEAAGKWWYVSIENREHFHLKTNPAEDCEIEFWLMRKQDMGVNTRSYKGRWKKDSWVEETESRRTLRVGVSNNIPIVYLSLEDRGMTKNRVIYITEAEFFDNDNPAYSCHPGEYIMLLRLYTGVSIWMEEILLLTIPEGKLEDFELKQYDETIAGENIVTKKQFHELLKREHKKDNYAKT